MTGTRRGPVISIVLPVRNGAHTVAQTIESVLTQSHSDLELVVSDNASTDSTRDICEAYAREDRRVIYRRHAANVGLLENFISGAHAARGTYVRWIGDDDTLEPEYVGEVLEVFEDDPRRVLVTTQIVYVDAVGRQTLNTEYDPSVLASEDPVERLAGVLRMQTDHYAKFDPLYGVIRRGVATMPRRNMLREDLVFAERMALAGPWGHLPAPLARRRRDPGTRASMADLLEIAGWRRHPRVLLQCRELSQWISRSDLDPAQQRRARAEMVLFYARCKRNAARRGVAKLERVTARATGLTPRPSP